MWYDKEEKLFVLLSLLYLLKQYLLYNRDKRIVMSEKLQQDHFKVAPKKHEDLNASTDDGKVEKPEQYLAGRGAQFNTKTVS